MDATELLPRARDGNHHDDFKYVSLLPPEPWTVRLTSEYSGIRDYFLDHPRNDPSSPRRRPALVAYGSSHCDGNERGLDGGNGGGGKYRRLPSHWGCCGPGRPGILDGGCPVYWGRVFGTTSVQLSPSAEAWEGLSLSAEYTTQVDEYLGMIFVLVLTL